MYRLRTLFTVCPHTCGHYHHECTLSVLLLGRPLLKAGQRRGSGFAKRPRNFVGRPDDGTPPLSTLMRDLYSTYTVYVVCNVQCRWQPNTTGSEVPIYAKQYIFIYIPVLDVTRVIVNTRVEGPERKRTDIREHSHSEHCSEKFTVLCYHVVSSFPMHHYPVPMDRIYNTPRPCSTSVDVRSGPRHSR